MKYVGSKNRIAKEILPIILKNRKFDQWYVEPFVGGCNIIDKVSGKRIGNDSNEYLIAFFYALVGGWKLPYITKEEYINIRDNKKMHEKKLVGWAGVGCSYSGKWFGGYAGKVNTKDGIRDYLKESILNVDKQKKSIWTIFFYSVSYDKLEIPENSIIYCDPPYRGTTKYKNDFDHDKFWKWCEKKVKDGHTVFVSEYEAPENWECIWKKELNSSLSANGKIGGNKKSIEKLFVLKQKEAIND